ncbi:response regulator [Shimia ponticola]|uniref:response regulator n=1 Tax=Shimia ponticola TaxID=2582893 RepID=UPI00164BF90E|nr:response regulator [Shimia ponticola]
MTTPVLLVDDDEDVRTAYGQTLELDGYDTILARALIEAVDHLHAGWPGVVVTDVKMPGRDGFDMLARVRKIDPAIPVIVLTGHADVPMAVRAMREGAFSLLEKPCSSAELLDTVRAATAARASEIKARRAAVKDVAPLTGSLVGRMAEVERTFIIEALQACDGQAARAAEVLGLPRKTLYDKLKRHNLTPEDYRG